MAEVDIHEALDRFSVGSQANFDQLSGESDYNARIFNRFVEDLNETLRILIEDINDALADHTH